MLRRIASRLALGCVICVYLSLCVISSNPFDPGGGEPERYSGSRVILQPRKCLAGEEGIVLVHSHARNSELRASQRRAKTSLGSDDLRFVFILFRSPEVAMEAVEREAEEHGDILLGDKGESYRGLVYKHLLAISWVTQHCAEVKHVIKMDDDISVDFRRLLAEAARSAPPTGLYMAGLLQLRLPILRSRRSKWAVGQEELSGSHYPDFLSGWCYLTTPRALAAVLHQLREGDGRVFWVDDVFISGLLAAKAGVQLVSLNMFFTVYRAHLDCCLREPGLECPYIVGPTDAAPEVLEHMARHSQRCWARAACRPRRGPSEQLTSTCRVDNPLFLPPGRAKAEVFVM